ncbi:O-antigen ligase family protein [Sulfuriferula nivalis]|uniref:O-antigen ligase-related domain-containing protein n=1 Tax=Sulfuriferula nivalis TaxID=2675298 RepID=A0A809S7G2_9PROT|nr:O-antigen ligase family protein [Sulfuriferula nivalis]BBO99521.1 hypothetical protein SFSGTM_02300 [Sulfuriferula nivalis]
MNSKYSEANKSQSLLFKIALFGFIGFALFIAGALTAATPVFAAKLLLIPLLLITIAMAFLSQTDKPLSDGFLKVWLAILLGTMALWPTYMIIKIGEFPAIDARRIVAGLSLAAMFFFLISRKDIYRSLFKENIGPLRTGSLLVTAYAIWRIASCFVSPSPIESLVQVFWEILYYYSMFFVGALFFSRPSLHGWVMTVFMVLAILISGYAGIEWIMKKNILLQFIPSGKDFADFQAALTLSRLRDGFFRSQSTFEHPLLLAEFSAMAVCFGLAAMLWTNKSLAFRVLGTITLIGAIAAAFLSGSRSALVTVAAGGSMVSMLWFFSPKQQITSGKSALRKLSFIMTLIAALAIALPAVTLLSQGKSKSEVTSTAARVQMLKLGIPSIEQYPLLGTGPGTGGMVAGILTGSGVRTLDNYFLAIAIESGVPAILLLLACLIYPMWVIFNRLINGTPHLPQYFAAILGCLIVTTLTHTVLWMPYNMFFTFILSGAALAAFSNTSRNDSKYPPPTSTISS